ncbi:hypothetical protein GCM10010211_12310 [Streptomyces albospinus]|uniref:Uncharacterized protein n=1 Tax=Streptomyces albospinus TaxID=285515 RepID=A0ABQ2URW3_9ACTN|nr:hypothetical protein [Streptomyces albospinus]GGU49656.1 hypothetical protein GCM10010211_12310 [Streptomyces albospinus]
MRRRSSRLRLRTAVGSATRRVTAAVLLRRYGSGLRARALTPAPAA